MTENVNPPQFDPATIPAALKSARQWLIWRLEHKPGVNKPAKMPYYASGKRRTGQQGSAADRAALVSFDEALAAKAAKKADGIGFAFLPGDGFIGIDIDNAIDPETGEISQRALRIIAACDSYAELSPSGKEFHIYVLGETDTAKDNGIGVEMFCGRQFFTVTGKHLAGTPAEVKPIPASVVKRLHKTITEAKGGFADKPTVAPAAPVQPTDERAKIKSALDAINPSIGHEDGWLDIGMALHAEFGDDGFTLWDAWSSRSEKYPGSAALRAKWSSFDSSRGIKIGTLFHLAKQAGWKAPRPARKPAPPTVRDEGPQDDWRRQLLRKDDRLIDCRENVYLMLRHHPLWAGAIWIDDFARRIVKHKPAPWDSAAEFAPGVEWSHEDDLRLGLWLAQRESLIVRSQENLAAAVAWVATESRYHPVRNYLDGLVWDKHERLADWLTDYLGVKRSEYAMLAGRFFLIGMVARIYEPGCQMRFVPILEGAQFRGKSSALRILGGEWFGDTMLDLNSKDTCWVIGRREEMWLAYWGELSGQTIVPFAGAWIDLDALLEKSVRHACGAALPIAAVAIDSSDGQTSSAVYDYVRRHNRSGRPVYAIKGASDAEGKIEIWRQPQAQSIDPHHNGRKSAKYGVHVQIVGTAKAKDSILGWAQEGGRVRLIGDGPHRMHWYETVRPDFYEQLLSEIKIPVRNNPKRRQWKKRTDRRNEALDCTVYALWMVHALRLHIQKPAWWDMTEERIRQKGLFEMDAAKLPNCESDPPAKAAPNGSAETFPAPRERIADAIIKRKLHAALGPRQGGSFVKGPR